MNSLTVRHIDEDLMARLRARAAVHGKSIEDEARDILEAAVSADDLPATTLYEAIRKHVEPWGGFDLPDIPREAMREPPDFSD